MKKFILLFSALFVSLLSMSVSSAYAAGTLEIAVSSNTPPAGDILYDFVDAEFLRFEMTASGSDVAISSLDFTRTGLGDNDDFEAIWLEIGGIQMGNQKGFNNGDSARLDFSPTIVIPAGQTITADVVASSKYSATQDPNDKNLGHRNGISLVAIGDVISTAGNVVGLPVEGGEMQIVDEQGGTGGYQYEVSDLVFDSLGSIAMLHQGDTFVEIGKFRLRNDSPGNKDIEIHAITFKNDGTANLGSSFGNVALYVSGVQISAETVINGDFITFRLDNGVTGGFVIDDGDSKIFSLRADIVSDELDKTLQFKIENHEDIEATEISTSMDVETLDSNDNYAEGVNATLATYTINPSGLVVTETSGVPDGEKIVAGIDDVTFAEFNMENNELDDAVVTSLTVSADRTLNTSSSTTGISGSTRTYSNFTLAVFVDGTQQGSAKNLNVSGKATVNDLMVVIPSVEQKEFVIVVNTIEHSANDISTAVNGTTTSSTSLLVDSTTGMTVGDIILVGMTPDYRVITAINTNTLILDSALTALDNATVSVKHQIKLNLEDVEADNVETGLSVRANDSEINEITENNKIEGTLFELIISGVLTVSLDSVIPSDILIAGQMDREVLKIQFDARDEEVQVKDIYLENDLDGDGTPDNTDIDSRLDFKLYNEAGQWVQTKTMNNGRLHFELANADRIRVPRDGSTFVTVKVDVRSITKATQTGKRLLLALDADSTVSTYKGIEAISATTGGDIDTPQNGWGDAVGEDFVVYKTEFSIAPSVTQPEMNLPSEDSTEFYRFTISSDSADSAEMGHLTLNMSLDGLEFDAGAEFITKRVINDVSDNNQTFTTTPVTATVDGDISVRLTTDMDGEQFSAGESRTYAIFVSKTQEVGSEEGLDGVIMALQQDSSYTVPTNKSGQSSALILWSDESDPSHTDSTLDWFNGYLLDVDTGGIRIQRDPSAVFTLSTVSSGKKGKSYSGMKREDKLSSGKFWSIGESLNALRKANEGTPKKIHGYINRNGYTVFSGYQSGKMPLSQFIKRMQNKVAFRGATRTNRRLSEKKLQSNDMLLADKQREMKEQYQYDYEKKEEKAPVVGLGRLKDQSGMHSVLTRREYLAHKVNKFERVPLKPLQRRVTRIRGKNMNTVKMRIGGKTLALDSYLEGTRR